MTAGKDGRIGGEHAVDVGPDLDLFRANPGADNRRRVIGSAPAQRGGDAIFCRADEPAHYDDVSLRQRRDRLREP